MDQQRINERVGEYFCQQNLNCATTTLLILAEHTGIDLSRQVLDAAVGMHGAGGFGAQCGLVEGTLMFLGILGRKRGLPDEHIIEQCSHYGAGFEETFSSLLCHELRPEGFAEDQPPHLCLRLTCRSIAFSVDFINQILKSRHNQPELTESEPPSPPISATTGGVI
jgi:Putative redox-active protein (C_GCAxxG_C_C)